MPSTRPFRCLIALLLGTAAASGQTPAPILSAAELTRLYVQHADAEHDEKQNYTFLIHAHNLTFMDGRLTNDNTSDSEQIFIGGQPYVRRLARNGKPLAGSDLKHENELYEKAVKDRAGLTDADRWKASHQQASSITFLPRDHFLSDFRQEIVGREPIDGQDCIVLDLTPLQRKAPENLRLHIRLTLDAKTFELVQYRVETLGQVGNYGKGSVFEQRDTYLENVWLPVFSKIDALVGSPNGLRIAHYVDTQDFTNYRRFSVTSTIHELPAGEPPPKQ